MVFFRHWAAIPNRTIRVLSVRTHTYCVLSRCALCTMNLSGFNKAFHRPDSQMNPSGCFSLLQTPIFVVLTSCQGWKPLEILVFQPHVVSEKVRPRKLWRRNWSFGGFHWIRPNRSSFKPSILQAQNIILWLQIWEADQSCAMFFMMCCHISVTTKLFLQIFDC